MHFFVTGTDTGVGKTYVTGLLLKALRLGGTRAAGWKPICCGDRTDALHLLAATLGDTDNPAAAGGDLTVDEVNPVWFKAPVSPLTAALLEDRTIDTADLRRRFEALTSRFGTVLVEGAGGWEVPLQNTSTMADFAAELALPVLVVVNNRLGALNHTILTVHSIRNRGLSCAGIILNHVDAMRDTASISNRLVLERLLPETPVLIEVQHGETELPPLAPDLAPARVA